ncbi:MAG: hypothetical protein PVI30_13230 [Myxococcales bacterium]|jgi:hypothetical protein
MSRASQASRAGRGLAAIALLLAGCGGADDGPGGAVCPTPRALDGGTPLPDAVAEVLDAKCWECHADPPQMFAPMALVTWEQMQAPRHPDGGEAVYEAIDRRIHHPQTPMPPITYPQLDAEELRVLEDWIADCAPPAG